MEKLFTVESATRATVLVRPIVRDILAKMKQAQSLHEEAKRDREEGIMPETEILLKLRLAEKFLNEIEYHMKELASVGVLLKDLELGCVDFPCMIEGEMAYLCWVPQEREVQFWHRISETFSGRKSLSGIRNIATV